MPTKALTFWRSVGPHLNLRGVSRLLTAERRLAVTPRVRIRAWRLGFTSASYLVYDLDHSDPRAFLPDAAVFRQRKAEGEFRRVLRDKALFSAVVGAHVRVPAVLAIVAKGKLFAASRTTSISGVQDLIAYCERSPGVFIKPAQKDRGTGVGSLRVDDSRLLLDERPAAYSEVAARIATLDDVVVTERIVQAHYAAAVFPAATNTIRIVTMQDPADGDRPFVAVAVHRFGVHSSMPVDNASRGGLVARIDPETGVLDAVRPNPVTGRQAHTHHPDTGAPIAGLQVPDWPAIRDEVLRLAASLDFLTFVGWDVVATEDGIVVIEGNNPPDRTIQRHHPFLADARIRRFFERHGVT